MLSHERLRIEYEESTSSCVHSLERHRRSQLDRLRSSFVDALALFNALSLLDAFAVHTIAGAITRHVIDIGCTLIRHSHTR